MKKITQRIATLWMMSFCISGLMLFSSCTEEEIQKLTEQAENTPTPTPGPDNSIPIPNWGDAAGVLVSTKVKTVQSGIAVEMGVASAVFYANLGDSTFADAGTVKCEDKELTKQSNNAYVFVPTQTEPMGITLSPPILWDIAGSGSVGAFSQSVSGSFPTTDSISSALTFANSAAYTLSVGSVSNADSVIFMVVGSSGTPLIKTISGNATSCTFTAAEMSTLPTGTGLIQVVPTRITDNTFSGKKYYFIRQTSVSKTVTIN